MSAHLYDNGGVENNPEFVEIDDKSRQILLWTMILNDIWKRGSPLLDCRDPFHLVFSACKAEEIFVEHGLAERKSGIEDFFEFIMKSFVIQWNAEIMDLRNIKEILRVYCIIRGF